MDELKLKLTTKVMRGIVAKLISRLIFKKFGCDINIRFEEIEIESVDGKVQLHANVDANMNKEDFIILLNSINSD